MCRLPERAAGKSHLQHCDQDPANTYALALLAASPESWGLLSGGTGSYHLTMEE